MAPHPASTSAHASRNAAISVPIVIAASPPIRRRSARSPKPRVKRRSGSRADSRKLGRWLDGSGISRTARTMFSALTRPADTMTTTKVAVIPRQKASRMLCHRTLNAMVRSKFVSAVAMIRTMPSPTTTPSTLPTADAISA